MPPSPTYVTVDERSWIFTTLRPAAGGSLNLTTANPPARRCTPPALPATRSSRLATLSSTVMHL